ncbi:hypothetical protein GPROT2_00410 [Gammaproteobacteria bacterium]|nr:hypothetical protein GPROT2_00410 [Gammaproteobacteria bacterium]
MKPAEKFQQALLDPTAIFRSPGDVLSESSLSADQKAEILSRWAYDAAELAVAEEEGMIGGDAGDMGAIIRALDQLASPDLQHSAPTKHAGFTTRR